MTCPFEGCQRVFQSELEFGDHILARHRPAGAAAAAPKIARPSVEAEATPASWANFIAKFDQYCSRAGYRTNREKVSELAD